MVADEFPSTLGPLNEIVLHPRLLRAVAQLLQCDECELRLQECSACGKTSSAAEATLSPEGRAAMSNADQRMHMDYPNMYVFDAVCFVYTYRRLIDLSLSLCLQVPDPPAALGGAGGRGDDPLLRGRG